MISKAKASLIIYLSLIILVTLGFTFHLTSERRFLDLENNRCQYEVYEGLCKITSVNTENVPESGPRDDDVLLRFEFKPAIIEDLPVYSDKIAEDKRTVHISRSFVDRLDIRAGDLFRCEMRHIVAGDCPKVAFDISWASKIFDSMDHR